MAKLTPCQIEGTALLTVSGYEKDGNLRITDVRLDGKNLDALVGMALNGNGAVATETLRNIPCRVSIVIEPLEMVLTVNGATVEGDE